MIIKNIEELDYTYRMRKEYDWFDLDGEVVVSFIPSEEEMHLVFKAVPAQYWNSVSFTDDNIRVRISEKITEKDGVAYVHPMVRFILPGHNVINGMISKNYNIEILDSKGVETIINNPTILDIDPVGRWIGGIKFAIIPSQEATNKLIASTNEYAKTLIRMALDI